MTQLLRIGIRHEVPAGHEHVCGDDELDASGGTEYRGVVTDAEYRARRAMREETTYDVEFSQIGFLIAPRCRSVRK